MTTRRRLLAAACLAALSTTAAVATAAPPPAAEGSARTVAAAAAAPPPIAEVGARAIAADAGRVPGDAIAACESAVGESLRELRGRAVQDVQFPADGRGATGDGARVDVKGTGRYRRGEGRPVEFRYSCAFDRASGRTSGVVLRESQAAAAAAEALPVWKADLSRLSPEACESAVASRLQATNARAGGIVFDSGGRQLLPGAEGRTALAGSGRLERAPGMAPSAFSYRCEFDTAGRLASATATD